MFEDVQEWVRRSSLSSGYSCKVFGVDRSCDISPLLQSFLLEHISKAPVLIGHYLSSCVPRGANVSLVTPRAFLNQLLPGVLSKARASVSLPADVVIGEPVAFSFDGVLVSPGDVKFWSSVSFVCVSVLQFVRSSPASLDCVAFDGKVVSELGVFPFDVFVREVASKYSWL